VTRVTPDVNRNFNETAFGSQGGTPLRHANINEESENYRKEHLAKIKKPALTRNSARGKRTKWDIYENWLEFTGTAAFSGFLMP
jgi:hypothetical protein